LPPALRPVDVRLVQDHQPRPPKITRQVERLGKEPYEPAAQSRLMVPGGFAHFDAPSTALVSLLGGRARAFARGCIGHNVVLFDGTDLFKQKAPPWRRGCNGLRPGTFRVPASRLCMQGSVSKGSDIADRPAELLSGYSPRHFRVTPPAPPACIRELSIVSRLNPSRFRC
jgi:hypothetical protein